MKIWKRAAAAAASIAILCSAAALPAAFTADAASLESSYTWGTMKIGGGGFVSGIVTGKDVMYARTDVGGAYKYNYDTDSWEQLFGFLNDAERGYLSVDAMAIDPTDDNTVYFLCGCAYFSDAGTRIYKTTDGGKTFTYVDVTDLIQVHGNGFGRQCGESIAIDPDNPNVLYCGGDVAADSSGLIKSIDGGKTWASVENFDKLGFFEYDVNWPQWAENHIVKAASTSANSNNAYTQQNGIATIVVLDGKVYVGVSKKDCANVVVADTKDDTFSILDKTLPTAVLPSRFTVDANGKLMISYIAGLTFADGAGGVYRYDPASGKTEDISPVENSIGTCICDPQDANKLYATTCAVWSGQSWDANTTCYGEWMYRSTDGGATWESVYAGKHDGIWFYDETIEDKEKRMHDSVLFDYMKDGGYAWIQGKAIHWSGNMMMNPRDTSQIYTVSGNGVFRWDNIWGKGYDDSPIATFHPTGIEEVVSLDFVSTADGLDLSAIGDYDGFVHTSPEEIPEQYQPNMGSTSAIAVCPQNTDVWVRVAENDNDVASGFYTRDRGKTWTKMNISKGSKAAVTQIDDDTYRIFATTKGGASYSDDWGETWNSISLKGLFYNMIPGIMPDSQNPSVVWAYGYSQAANQWDTTPTEYKLYKSTDGGKTFSDPVRVCDYDYCDAATRIADLGDGNLVVAGGWHGAYYIDGSTMTPEKLDVFYCKTIGYGAPEKKGSVNALYMYGRPTEEDTEGIYRSTDAGKTWDCINTKHLYGGTGNGNYLVGDMNEFGKVYMSTVGCGIVYGMVSGSAPVETPTETPTSSDGIVWGDADESGKVDILDVITMNKALLGKEKLTDKGLKNGDLNQNGKPEAADSLNIMKLIVGLLKESDCPVK